MAAGGPTQTGSTGTEGGGLREKKGPRPSQQLDAGPGFNTHSHLDQNTELKSPADGFTLKLIDYWTS